MRKGEKKDKEAEMDEKEKGNKVLSYWWVTLL